MQEKTISLTEAEWKVMECLWEKAPCTGRDAALQLEEQMGWSRSTTLTLLRRLTAKGAVVCDTHGKKNKFSPLLKREDAVLQETEDFLSRVYHGSLSLMVSALTKKQALSQSEIDQLYQILQQIEEEPHA